MSEENRPISVRSFLPTALFLIVLGWGGFFYIWTQTEPSGGTRWLMFFTAVLAFTGTILLPVAFLNKRFPSSPPASSLIILRQSLWVGIYFPTLAWLQIGRVLTPRIAVLLAVGLALIEWLLRLRERSQKKHGVNT